MGSKKNQKARPSTGAKNSWKTKHPPDADGNYLCAICHLKVHISVVTLDHIHSVEEWPELAKDPKNWQPTHEFCNQEKAFSVLKQLRQKGILGTRKRYRPIRRK